MIKKIKSSLTIKIFFITSLLLVLACSLTYQFIAYSVPINYNYVLDEELQKKELELIKNLEETDFENGKRLIRQFMIHTNTEAVLLDENSKQIEILPLKEIEKITAKRTEEEGWIQDKTAVTIRFHAPNPKKEYILIIETGKVKEINEVNKAFKKILPKVCILILIISFLTAFVYSSYISKPIIKISKISRKMGDLDFTFKCDGTRNDEIGILEQSLNELSERLSITLEELKKANISLANDLEKEKKLEKQKQNFFSSVSHELKTPITIVKGQLEGMIYQIGVYQDRDTYLKKSLEVIENMEKLVREILSISRIELKETLMQKETIHFTKLIQTQIEQYLELIKRKELILETQLEEITIQSDMVLLERVISNLFSNAIHYSPIGEKIKIKTTKEEKIKIFSIENTGIHIPNEAIPKLTEAFYRVEQSRNKKTGGSGLGLYIVKVILEREEAEFKIENTEDGVCVTIFFT